MYQYFKYSNSLLFPFDWLSSCFGSLDIRSLGVFTETFLDRYHLDICKSNAKAQFRRRASAVQNLIAIWFDCSKAGKQLLFRRRARVEPNSGFTDAS